MSVWDTTSCMSAGRFNWSSASALALAFDLVLQCERRSDVAAQLCRWAAPSNSVTP